MSPDFGEEILHIRRQLEIEETREPINTIVEVAFRKKQRQELRSLLDTVSKEVRSLYVRFKRLPMLPDSKSIQWAQSVLATSNACILTVDVDTSTGDSALLRIHLLDLSEDTLFDQVLALGYILTAHTMRNFGITHQDLQNAHSLPQIWNSLLDMLMGKFVVCYELEHVRTLLEKYARQYDLESPVILGECLLLRVLHYFRTAGFVGLPALCQHIGSPLPEPPDCTILDRVYGQLHLLQTMAQGIAGSNSQSFLNESLNDDELEETLLYEQKEEELQMKTQHVPSESLQRETETLALSVPLPISSLALTIPQVAQQLGLSPAKVYHLVALERLPTVKFGRAVRVPYTSLLRWLKEREQDQQS